MPKNAQDKHAAKRRTSVKDLPRVSKALDSKDMKKVKGGSHEPGSPFRTGDTLTPAGQGNVVVSHGGQVQNAIQKAAQDEDN